MSKSAVPSESPYTDSVLRRYWIRIPLFFVVYLAVVFSLIFYTGLWQAAQPYAELILQYPALVRFSTFVLCSGCAWFFFWPREGSRFIGRWSDYVGLAFATFAVQYGLRFLEIQLEESNFKSGQEVFHHLSMAIIYLCSALNNLLFFAASRILLQRNTSYNSFRPLKEDPRVLNQLKEKLLNTLAEFRTTVPAWAFLWAALAPLALLESRPGMFWARYPDALFSLYCLCWFGYAIAVNLNMRRRKVLAASAMLVALVYGGAQIVYATNPVIAHAVSQESPTSSATQWIKETVGYKVTELQKETNAKTNREDGTKVFLDNAVFAMLLPMKLALFLPAFSLYLLFFIISVNDMRPALFESISRRKDYLSSDGIVTAIGRAIGAEQVSLYIRIPGRQELPTGKGERALPLIWHDDNGSVQDSQAVPVLINDHLELKRIMKEEGTEVFGPVRSAPGVNDQTAQAKSQWWVPVRFHGGVIGALQAVLVGDRKNHTTLQKFRLMTDLIAPSVQDYRSLAAMDQMGFSFTRLQVEFPKDNFEESTKRVATVIHDVLSPLASGLIIEIGFTEVAHFEAENEEDEGLLGEQKVDSWLQDGEKQLVGTDKSILLEKNLMVVRIRDTTRPEGFQLIQLPIGGLMFAIPAKKDNFYRPTLAAYYLNRKAVASLVADNVFDLARNSLGEIINDLGVEFSKEQLSHRTWFAAVQTAVLRSGMLWVIAAKETPGEQRELIEPDPVMSEDEKRALFEEPLSTPEAASLPASHIVSLALPKSRHRLWLGIRRAGFGPELNFQSPWRNFLTDLTKVADAALDSLKMQQEAELAKQNQGVITIAVMTGTLMHQVLNMIRDQLFTTEMLEEETKISSVQLTDRCKTLLRALRTSALHGSEMTQAFTNVTQIKGPWPCNIKETAQEAYKLYRMSLNQRLIEVVIDPSTDILADVPFFISAFTLANLIGNARDAIWTRGRITIEAEETRQFVLCHVTNNGPEISPETQEILFEFGKSHKKEGHNGWGLYFSKRALIDNGGDIWLAHSDEKSTRFTIQLPKKHPIREFNGTLS